MHLSVEGTRTHYLDINPQGSKTVVILHGWASSVSFWLPVTRLLSPHWRIILPDLPGFGLTPPIDSTPDIPEYTHFVRSFTQKLSLKKFVLVGHSFGGQIALDYALKHPADLTTLILIAPAAIRERSRLLKLKLRLTSTIKRLLSQSSYNHLESYLGWYTPTDYAHANEYQKKVLQKITRYNLQPLLGKLSVSTDIIWGSNDFVVPNAGRYLSQNIPQSRLHLIPGANHLLNLTHPQKLAKIINSLLSTLPTV